MGAIIKAGSSPEKPLKFILPEHDFTYHTKNFHPMRLEVFETLVDTVSNAKQPDEIKAHPKRKRSNWFILDAHEKTYLKHGDNAKDNDDHHASKRKSSATAASTAANAAAAAETFMDTTSDEELPLKKVKRLRVKVVRGGDVKVIRGGEEDSNVEAIGNVKGKKKKKHQQEKEKEQEEHPPPHQRTHKPQKWKDREKKLFFDALDKHGEFCSLVFLCS